jgi:hypothetical protein
VHIGAKLQCWDLLGNGLSLYYSVRINKWQKPRGFFEEAHFEAKQLFEIGLRLYKALFQKREKP